MGVQFVTNAGNLAARNRFKAKLIDAALKKACKDYAIAVQSQARRLSQGPLKTAALRRIKPGLYSTKRPARTVFDATINMQTGLFAQSWHYGTYSSAGGVTVTVWNSAPYAKYMMGTLRMRQRPILDMAMGMVGAAAASSAAAGTDPAASASADTSSSSSASSNGGASSAPSSSGNAPGIPALSTPFTQFMNAALQNAKRRADAATSAASGNAGGLLYAITVGVSTAADTVIGNI